MSNQLVNADLAATPVPPVPPVVTHARRPREQCVACGGDVPEAELRYIVPVAEGAAIEPDGLTIVCRACHHGRG